MMHLKIFTYLINWFILNWRIIALQFCVSFCCKYTYIPSLLSLPPTHLCHHRALSWAPCAIQQLLTSCLFYRVVYICQSQSPISSQPPLSSLLCPHISSRCLCRSRITYHSFCQKNFWYCHTVHKYLCSVANICPGSYHNFTAFPLLDVLSWGEPWQLSSCPASLLHFSGKCTPTVSWEPSFPLSLGCSGWGSCLSLFPVWPHILGLAPPVISPLETRDRGLGVSPTPHQWDSIHGPLCKEFGKRGSLSIELAREGWWDLDSQTPAAEPGVNMKQ